MYKGGNLEWFATQVKINSKPENMQAILLAAGFGTRLRPYTEVKPKPLFPIMNRPLLHILLDKLFSSGCSKVVVNCHHLADQVKEAVKGRNRILIQDEPEILGTGGSLRKALGVLDDEAVLVMNGDLYHDIDIGELHRHHLASPCRVTMAMHDYPRFNSVRVNGDFVESFTSEEGGKKRAFTGVHVVDPEIIEMIPSGIFFHVIDLYEQLAGQQEVGVHKVDGCSWWDIGTPQDYLELHASLLSEGTRDSRWLVDESAIIEAGVRLEEWGVIGPGSVIKKGARLARSVVWEHSVVGAEQSVEDAIITGIGDRESRG